MKFDFQWSCGSRRCLNLMSIDVYLAPEDWQTTPLGYSFQKYEFSVHNHISCKFSPLMTKT